MAAVMYGVGARLDEKPELLFTLRHVDHKELVSRSGAVEALTAGKGTTAVAVLDTAEVGDVFGIEMAVEPEASVVARKPMVKKVRKKKANPMQRKAAKKKATGRKTKAVKSKVSGKAGK